MMDQVTARAPEWKNEAHTLIDMLVTFPVIGEFMFTASPSDIEAHGRELFDRAAAGEFGVVAEFVPPAP